MPDVKQITTTLCDRADLVVNAGVCALHKGEQIAIFYLPDVNNGVYALQNWDPLGNAAVLSRGITGDIDGRLVVASPLYKQHFDLATGECLEDGDIKLKTYRVSLVDDAVVLHHGAGN
ncbi:MAG: nitrite reductase small subunit NirD [Pseudomonadales bacterium]|nr:nitrite reductase small subunit NirD [Pseudomonadales bacterium]